LVALALIYNMTHCIEDMEMAREEYELAKKQRSKE